MRVYEIIILSHEMFWYENWSLAEMEVGESIRDGELWKMFERMKKQFVQMLDKLHNKELDNS
jgi:hypothetical protein